MCNGPELFLAVLTLYKWHLHFTLHTLTLFMTPTNAAWHTLASFEANMLRAALFPLPRECFSVLSEA